MYNHHYKVKNQLNLQLYRNTTLELEIVARNIEAQKRFNWILLS